MNEARTHTFSLRHPDDPADVGVLVLSSFKFLYSSVPVLLVKVLFLCDWRLQEIKP